MPALRGYSDHIPGVSNLWRVIIEALIKWLSICALEIFTLLSAIAKALSNIHKGEAVDNEGEKLTWAQFP